MNTSDFVKILENRINKLTEESAKLSMETLSDYDKQNELLSKIEELHYIWDIINK